MDIYTEKKRSEIMSLIRGKDTKPELIVRRLVYSMGYRYRLHVRSLPGNPDLVFLNRRKVIFVHGCFWHRHNCKRGQSMPASNKTAWQEKFTRNLERDRQQRTALKKDGWGVLVIWECETESRKMEFLAERIQKFLDWPPSPAVNR